MRRNRALWASIIFVLVLVGASAIGLAGGSLRPTLGLDLQGGASVILTAPEGTPQDVMEQALENIRNRVDAFGVGEPDIALSGTTIEVQIPGSADATVRPREADLYCLEGEDLIHGCSEDEDDVGDVLESLEVKAQPSEVCVVDGSGEQVECFSSRAQAETFLAGVQVGPREDESPSPSATSSASASPTASPSAGPSPAASAYCLTAPTGDRIGCFKSRAQADDANEALKVEVTERSYCVLPAPPEPSPTPTPSATATATATATPSASASASPSASPSPAAATFADLDLSSAEPLPCGLGSREEADDALAATAVVHEEQQFCVFSSAGQRLECSIRRDEAEDIRRQSGQERLLRVIGETARLEERSVLEIVPASDPRPVTCGTAEERDLPRCSFDALANEEVVYPGPVGNGQFAKFVLGPVVISGENFDSAAAVLSSQGQLGGVSQWTVTFELDDDGADRFAEATTQAVGAPPPTDQIAIIVDRVVISSPTVQSAITGGSGEITGGFAEAEAKDLATQLNAGALPVELTRQSVRTVSPTLGEESLRQGIIAGIAGLLLLFLYLLFYYRLLGVVAWLGMTIWAVLAVGLISIAGDQFGYALSLSGVAGLVISLGVTADSYIVFFERLKDEVRSGKSARAAVQPAFARAYKTIVAADIVAILAAVVLYLTAVSSVRGFALTLGVATLLDLFVVYFFKRPTVFLIAKSPRLVGLRGFGLTSGVAGEVTHEGAGL